MVTVTTAVHRRTVSAATALVALVVIMVAAAWLGYRAGQHAGRSVTVRHGTAYSSGSQASVTADGWTYNVPLGAGSDWFDSQGEEHLGGTPSCLASVGTARITFGTVSYERSGALQRTVVWVRCP